MVAGVIVGLVATWATFVPCFLWIFMGAPFIERLRDNRSLTGAITAAGVGMILNLAVWFAIHTIFRTTVLVHGFGLSLDHPVPSNVDSWALGLAVIAAFAILLFKVGMLSVLAGSAAAGAIIGLTTGYP